MKSVLILAAAIGFGSTAHAGFPPSVTCSNPENTITIAMTEGSVSILTGMNPAPESTKLDLSDLNVKTKTLRKLPEETYGKTSRQVTVAEITLSRKDGAALPHAYNRLAREGKLNDIFLCVRSQAWF